MQNNRNFKPRQKPHKAIIAKMKENYFSAKHDAKLKNFTKEEEVELCYLQNEIERRWFRFFADHYIDDTVKAYCQIVEKAPSKITAMNKR